MALMAGMNVDDLVDHVFNFPTLAEAYRVAALDVVGQRERRARGAAPSGASP
jgi:NAD(P) transhydrogenase